MDTMASERKKARPRRSFAAEFKADIVQACRALVTAWSLRSRGASI
jgi:hypothetical protein